MVGMIHPMHTALHLCRLHVVCVRSAELKRATNNVLEWSTNIIKQQMNSGADNAICKLCTRRKKDTSDHTFFGAKLIFNAKKYG